MNEGYSDYGYSDDDGELPRSNGELPRKRYSGVPCPNCGAGFPTLALLERHELHCGRSNATARAQWLEAMLRNAGGAE